LPPSKISSPNGSNPTIPSADYAQLLKTLCLVGDEMRRDDGYRHVESAGLQARRSVVRSNSKGIYATELHALIRSTGAWIILSNCQIASNMPLTALSFSGARAQVHSPKAGNHSKTLAPRD
jgi:hypothetical protein